MNPVINGLYKVIVELKCLRYQIGAIMALKASHAFFHCKSVKFRGRIKLQIRGNIVIGSDFRCNSGPTYSFDSYYCSKISVAKGASLIIGNHTGMSNVTISCKQHIAIGDYVNIGGGCLIMDSNHHSLDWKDRTNIVTDKLHTVTAPVVIEDHVFIGTRSIICKGVRIGEKSIVAAGSVVICNIPEGEVWGGNPAKFIKKAE